MSKIHEGVEYFEPNRSLLELLPATKKHQGGLGDSEDESDPKIFSVPDNGTGQQSAPQIQLEPTDFVGYLPSHIQRALME